MDENVLKFRVGIFVLIAFVILGILIMLNSEGFVSQYSVYVKPLEAPGVTVGTPIRKNGILIGRVKSVTMGDDHVLLELGINRNGKIYANETVSIGTESLFGDAVVKFLPLSVARRGDAVGEGHNIETVTLAPDPLKLVADLGPDLRNTLNIVQGAGRSVDEAGRGIGELASTIQGVLDDDSGELRGLLRDFRKMGQRAEVALANFNKILENVNGLTSDPELKGKFRDALAEVPKLFQEIRTAVSDVRDTFRSFGSIPENVNSNLENLNEFTQKLKENGPIVIEQVNNSLRNVDEFLVQLKTFTGKFQNSDGTISKLVNDPELYNAALETVKNVRDQSVKLEAVMDDIRNLADQLARDPSAIVKGALNRRPAGAGYKGTAGGVDRRGGIIFRQ